MKEVTHKSQASVAWMLWCRSGAKVIWLKKVTSTHSEAYKKILLFKLSYLYAALRTIMNKDLELESVEADA